MPGWIEAASWGLLAGGALVLGALVAWVVSVPKRMVAWIMAFGAGVLVSALAFDLVDEAEITGGLTPTVLGFLAGAVAYVAVNAVLARRGAQHRKRSGDRHPAELQQAGSGTAIAVGALLDGVPESVVLGASLIDGGGVAVSVLVAVFISNFPEGLSSASGMKRSGRGARYVFSVWVGIAIASGVAAAAGYLLLDGTPPAVTAAVTAMAAGGILAMIADTMIPEAFEEANLVSGLVTALGFLTAFVVQRAGA